MKVGQIKIGLIVDNPKRDLPGLVLLARELARLGFPTFLIPMYLQGFEVPALALDVVVVNYARKANTQFIQSYAAAGIAVCVLDTEGGVWEDENQFVKSTNHQECAPLITAYCFWGPRQKKAFAAMTKLRPEAMFVTGCPRFDFYHQSMIAALPQADQFSLSPLLIISNFALSNPRFGSPEAEIQAMIDAGYERDYALFRQTEDAKNRQQLKLLVARLAKDYPDRPIVIRTHPFESDADYISEFSNTPNVMVRCEGTVGPWLKSSAIALHFNSSVSIDAFLMKKPMAVPKWLTSALTKDMAEISFGLSLMAESYDHLRKIIDEATQGNNQFKLELFEPRAVQLLRDWFVENDGQAFHRVADVLSRIAKSSAPPKLSSLAKILKTGSRDEAHWVSRVDYLGRSVLGAANYQFLRDRYLNRSRGWEARRLKAFNQQDVAEILSKLNQLFSDGHQIQAATAEQADYAFSRVGSGSIRVSPRGFSSGAE